jgi:FG-GAP-like repeat
LPPNDPSKESTMTTTPRLVKPQTQVNTTDGGADQFDGQIAALQDGGYVVVWTDNSQSPGAIVAQRYDAAGNKVGGERPLGPLGVESSPAVTVLPNGNIAVAFNIASADISVRIFDPALHLRRTDNIDLGGIQTLAPSITAFADGTYVVSYVSALTNEVLARAVSATGVVGNPFLIGRTSANPELANAELATLSDGNFVAVFQDIINQPFYGIFTKTGMPVVPARPLPVPVATGPEQPHPDVAALRDGGFVVVWTAPGADVADIWVATFSNAGAPLAFDLVNTTTAGVQSDANVVALADGGFLVTWVDDVFAAAVQAQRFDAVGHKIGTEFTVELGFLFVQALDGPQAALLSDGRIAFAINNTDVLSSDTDVVTSIWRVRDVSHDFDGDGKSGVLWRHDSGQVYFWEMNGLGVKNEGGVAHAPVPTDWHIQGAGDFDGDGNNDVLWRHDSGQVYFWEMVGLAIKAEGGVAHAPVPNDWHVQGVGDFNADGKSDILWRHDSGQVYIWEMDGLNVKTEGTIAHAGVPNDWHIQGLGDFDGDGHSDILWRHDTGQVYIWEMNGLGTKAEGTIAHAAVPNDWHIQGIGDFDGDGKSDLLWRHDSGQVYIWEMEGLNVKTEGTIAHAPVPNDWHVQDIGDYNGDAKSDILWRHDSGQVYLWEMNGLQVTAEGAVPHAPVPSDWHIFSQHNFV